MFVTNWISTTKIQKISEITNFFRHYFLSRTEVGTVWIHQFDREENVDDGSAAALYFGKETVEYYALDNNLKVLRLIEKLQYRVVGQKLSIGIKEGVLGDNYLTFKNERYYRSDKKITDMLTPQNSK